NEFGTATMDDAFSTGSSIMPQKKNPDVFELTRGKTGRVYGDLMALLTVMKGLPLAYNKDMQEDKEAVFDTVDTVSGTLRVSAIVLQNIGINADRSREAAMKGYLNATELADYLVAKGVPFRTAHDTVGRAVLGGIEIGKELHEMSIAELREFSTEIVDDVREALSLESTLGSKNQIGGTSPERVAEALDAARGDLDREVR
ncbi:MAG TPA: lyase family protein, partial [Pyrinomonadaceae bacterium]|nr:lyase family protein [Pyrinomonadaceae bacterium]